MICGYQFIDKAVCMQEFGHEPIGGVAHIHPDDVEINMWPGQCQHKGSYFELQHKITQTENKFRLRWLQELSVKAKDSVELEIEYINTQIDLIASEGYSANKTPRIAVELHGRLMKLKSSEQTLSPEHKKEFVAVARRLLEEGFKLNPDDAEELVRNQGR